MSGNETNAYDVDPHIAEIYDQFETSTDDIDLIRILIKNRGKLRILEPFCGTGRIAIPLALDGHELVGFDQATAMLDRAKAKIAALPEAPRDRIRLSEADATTGAWPVGFDMILLGGNCFYELATPDEQQECIRQAALSLTPGGYVYVDNDHMEGELDPKWTKSGVHRARFPTGLCSNGTRIEATTETIWYDAPGRLVRLRRTVTVTRPDGSVTNKQWIQQKHPVSQSEVKGWLQTNAFMIEAEYGAHDGSPYYPTSPRAIFWARRGKSEGSPG